MGDLWGDWIIRAGAIVTAAILLLQALYRYVIRPVYDVGVGDKIDALTEKLESATLDTATQIAKVSEQLKPNGGSSLKDQTNRIEATLQRHIVGERERHRIIAIELKATNDRVDSLLRRGHSDHVHISEQITEHEPPTDPIQSED